MVVGEVASSTEVLVIGGGPGGYAAALRSAQRGREVTLVERGDLGGTCLNVGCIPSKTLIHIADLVAMKETAREWGVDLEVRVDMARLQAHLRAVVGQLRGGVEGLLAAAGVTVVRGVARFSKPNRVALVSGEAVRHIEFSEAIIATGSRPAELPALPFADERVLSSSEALALDSLPKRLVVVGGGYVGVELGTAFAKLGSRVTIVEALGELLPQMPRRLGRLVRRSLERLGVEVVLDGRVTELSEAGLRFEAEDGGGELEASRIIVAVGRRPNTDELGLAVAGVQIDELGHIVVDPDRRAARHVLAIGDVTGGPALAHKAMAEAEVAAATVSGVAAAFDPACVPEVVFSDPEVVSVGLTFEEAQASGYEPLRGRFPCSASARARSLSKPEGEIEAVAAADGTVLGFHMVGVGVSELAGEAALAIEMGASLEDVALTIHPHPTLSEGLFEAAWGALGRSLHVAGPGAGKGR